MSMFTEPTPTTEAVQTDNQNTVVTPDDYVSMIVTEKGEQWNDPQAIAKGYVHAQSRIKELEAAVAAADKNDYSKELLSTLRQEATPSASVMTEEKPKAAVEPSKPNEAPTDIKSLIESTLTERESTRIAEANVSKVESKLTELFGTEATKVITDKATQLGMSLQRLKDIAAESPDAFLTLIGSPQVPETNSLPASRVNTTSVPQAGGVRNQAYYDNLRRTQRATFHSPAIQAQMMEDASKLGQAFFN